MGCKLQLVTGDLTWAEFPVAYLFFFGLWARVSTIALLGGDLPFPCRDAGITTGFAASAPIGPKAHDAVGHFALASLSRKV